MRLSTSDLLVLALVAVAATGLAAAPMEDPPARPPPRGPAALGRVQERARIVTLEEAQAKCPHLKVQLPAPNESPTPTFDMLGDIDLTPFNVEGTPLAYDHATRTCMEFYYWKKHARARPASEGLKLALERFGRRPPGILDVPIHRGYATADGETFLVTVREHPDGSPVFYTGGQPEAVLRIVAGTVLGLRTAHSKNILFNQERIPGIILSKTGEKGDFPFRVKLLPYDFTHVVSNDGTRLMKTISPSVRPTDAKKVQWIKSSNVKRLGRELQTWFYSPLSPKSQSTTIGIALKILLRNMAEHGMDIEQAWQSRVIQDHVAAHPELYPELH